MKIELFADGLTKKDVPIKPIREAARAIIKKDQLYLLLFQKNLDVFVTAGGGLEGNESKEEALYREVLEETGHKVTKALFKVSVVEYFPDSTWINHYFITEVDFNEKVEIKLTEAEKSYEIEFRWYPLNELLDLLDNYESTNPYGSAIHNREFIGIFNSIEID